MRVLFVQHDIAGQLFAMLRGAMDELRIGDPADCSGALATSAFVVTHTATAAAALAWMLTEWLSRGKPTVLGAASGAVAGLEAITPASGYVGPLSAIIIGVVWVASSATMRAT